MKKTEGGTHLSGGRLASEKLVIERAVRRLKLGLQKYAAIGDGLQRGRAFVGEAEAYEELTNKRTRSVFRMGEALWGDENGWDRSARDTTAGNHCRCGH